VDRHSQVILSEILKKRLITLGYPSLRKLFMDRKDLGVSYELLRQVVHTGRKPRSETLLRILQAMRFSPGQCRKIMEMSYGGFPQENGGAVPAGETDATRPAAFPDRESRRDEADLPPDLSFGDPDEIAGRFARSLQKIPVRGNEDFWDMVRQIAALAEKKVRTLAWRQVDQPLLFEKEPEAVYHFLVRSERTVPYMAKGESATLAFSEDLDYPDRFRGALLGAAAGDALGGPAHGLSPRDVRELYGRIGEYRGPGGRRPGSGPPPAFLLQMRALLRDGILDPAGLAALYAASPESSEAASMTEFARNMAERGLPWFEAGINAGESLPAARVVPVALLRAGDFRRLKLDAGLDASVTHPNAAAVAGAIVHAAAIARLLHAPPGTVDPLAFCRSTALVVAGFDADRASRVRAGRPGPSLWRRLGTDLPALLMRRATVEEIRESLGNGVQALEGIPFAWACFLRTPDDFGTVVLSAVNSGHDARGTAAMAGALCGAYLGASGIPDSFLSAIPWRKELEEGAAALLKLATAGSKEPGRT
jgi:poly(ADP-ribose) glycohydrolase ARH3